MIPQSGVFLASHQGLAQSFLWTVHQLETKVAGMKMFSSDLFLCVCVYPPTAPEPINNFFDFASQSHEAEQQVCSRAFKAKRI